MPHTVIVLPEFRVPTDRSLGITFHEETAAAMQDADQAPISKGIAPGGPDAIFNKRQIGVLLEEFRAAANYTPRNVQANLIDVVKHIEEHLSVRDDAFVYFLAG